MDWGSIGRIWRLRKRYANNFPFPPSLYFLCVWIEFWAEDEREKEEEGKREGRREKADEKQIAETYNWNDNAQMKLNDRTRMDLIRKACLRRGRMGFGRGDMIGTFGGWIISLEWGLVSTFSSTATRGALLRKNEIRQLTNSYDKVLSILLVIL